MVEDSGGPDAVPLANDNFALEIMKSVEALKIENEIRMKFNHYKDLIQCVKLNLCVKKSACEMYAQEIQDFHENFSELFFKWQKKQNKQKKQDGSFTEALKHFQSDCGDDRVIGGQRDGLKENSYLSAGLVS